MTLQPNLERMIDQGAHLLVSSTLQLTTPTCLRDYMQGQRYAAKFILQSILHSPRNRKMAARAIRNWIQYYRKRGWV